MILVLGGEGSGGMDPEVQTRAGGSRSSHARAAEPPKRFSVESNNHLQNRWQSVVPTVRVIHGL